MSFLCLTSFYLFAIQAIIFYFLQISGEVVRLLETDGDFLVRETVRNDEKQIVLSVRILNSFLYGDNHVTLSAPTTKCEVMTCLKQEIILIVHFVSFLQKHDTSFNNIIWYRNVVEA